MTNTLAITFFFSLKDLPDSTSSVRDLDFYLENGKTTLAIKSPLMIFCDSVTHPKIKALREELCPDIKAENSIYIIRNITDYDIYKLNHPIITDNRKKSKGYKDANERNTPSYFITTVFKFIAIRIAKDLDNFLKDILKHNNFTHYAWIDFGCSHIVERAAEFIPKMIEAPNPKFSCVYIHYHTHNQIENMGSYLEYFNPCGIAAGVWTIEKDIVDLFYTRFMAIFYEQISKGVGHSEEGVLIYMYDRYPEMFHLNYGDYYSLLTNYHNIIKDYHTIKSCFINKAIENGRQDLAKTCVKRIQDSVKNGSLELPKEEIDFLNTINPENNLKICYAILSCNAYKYTRNEWQKKTWLKNIENDPNADYYFLFANMGEDRHCVGWETEDNYESCPHKYRELIKNMDLSNFDYVFFCDDDTYVFHSRLKEYLSQFDKSKKLMIGRKGDYGDIIFMSGGGGFALSSSLYQVLRGYICKEYDRIPIMRNSDVTMGLWIKNIMEEYKDIEYKVSDLIPSDNHHRSPGYTPEKSLTFHYVTEELFNYYYSVDK